MPKVEKAAPMSRKARRAAAKELAEEKKRLKRERSESKRSLKARMATDDKEAEEREKRAKAGRRRAKDVFNLIGFNLMFEDGTCEVEEGLFSQSIAFSDISYQSAAPETQKLLLGLYMQMFDYASPETSLQTSIINTPLPKGEIGKKVFFDETDPKTREYTHEYNAILNRKMMDGVSNLTRERYLTFTAAAESYEAALPRLARMRGDLIGAFAKLGCAARQLDGTERLRIISSQTRPTEPFDFDYLDLLENGLVAKDYICPTGIDFAPEGDGTLYRADGKWCQVLVFRHFGSQLADTALSEMIDLPMPLNVSLHVRSLDRAKADEFVKSRLGWIDKEIVEYQQKAVKKGFDYQLLPQELSYSKNEAEELLGELQYQNQRLFIFTGLVYTYADTLEELRDQSLQIMSVARQNSIEVDVLDCQQREGMNSVLPVGNNHVGISRYLTTSQVAMMVPFATQELNQPGGGYYGQNKVSSNLIIANRKALAAPMGFVLGMPGSGKSFAVKREITNTFFTNPDDEFIIIDPQGEYPPLVELLGGSVVRLSPGSPDHINPFDVYAGAGKVTGEDPTLFKSESVLALASEIMKTSDAGLSPEAKAIVDRCVRKVYADASASGSTPTLGTFYEVLKLQPEAAAEPLKIAFERYVTGGLDYFNHETTIDIEKRITAFSFRQLGEDMRVFAMLVILDFAYNRMLYNFERGVTTWLYIDEVQSLFANQAVLAYFDKFWAEGRKFNLIPTGITQTVERIIEHPTAKHLLANSDFLMLLKQSDRDRKNLANIIGLSPQQEECIGRKVEPGEGLLIAGSAMIPFRDSWPKGKLYDLWNTKPTELAEQKKAAWEAAQKAAAEKESSDGRTCVICGAVEEESSGKVLDDGRFLCRDCAAEMGESLR